MNTKLYNVGTYIRLSRGSSDYRDGESYSIENQQAMLSKFIGMMPGWIETRIYIDDGVSGANFNRRGFRDMMEDVRRGVINLVLVNDLSRFGRNYLEAGKYLEGELPALGCRFVALSDGVDTETGENDIMPFLNAVNDYYLRNLSGRIKSTLAARAKDGQKLSGAVPYGYVRNPEDHTRIIADEYAARVVRRIFEMRAAGMGYGAITGILNKDDILPPRLYYFKRQHRKTKAVCAETWSTRTVKLILKNEIYNGHTVSFKRGVRSYRDNTVVKRGEGDWIRVENTHTPIIDDELWLAVQKINSDAKQKCAGSREPRRSLFSGIAVCADCGANLGYIGNSTRYKNGRIVKYGGYECRTHRRSGGAVCSWHRISERNLIELAFGNIREILKKTALNENRILMELRRRLAGNNNTEKLNYMSERRQLEQQLFTLEVEMDQLYEDRVSGVVSMPAFTAIMEENETRRLDTQERLCNLKQTAKQTGAKFSDVNLWIELIKEKSAFNEADRDLIVNLIEKIEIGEGAAVDGMKIQDVRIYYKYDALL